jgi:hypothetical protein
LGLMLLSDEFVTMVDIDARIAGRNRARSLPDGGGNALRQECANLHEWKVRIALAEELNRSLVPRLKG